MAPPLPGVPGPGCRRGTAAVPQRGVAAFGAAWVQDGTEHTEGSTACPWQRCTCVQVGQPARRRESWAQVDIELTKGNTVNIKLKAIGELQPNGTREVRRARGACVALLHGSHRRLPHVASAPPACGLGSRAPCLPGVPWHAPGNLHASSEAQRPAMPLAPFSEAQRPAMPLARPGDRPVAVRRAAPPMTSFAGVFRDQRHPPCGGGQGGEQGDGEPEEGLEGQGGRWAQRGWCSLPWSAGWCCAGGWGWGGGGGGGGGGRARAQLMQ